MMASTIRLLATSFSRTLTRGPACVVSVVPQPPVSLLANTAAPARPLQGQNLRVLDTPWRWRSPLPARLHNIRPRARLGPKFHETGVAVGVDRNDGTVVPHVRVRRRWHAAAAAAGTAAAAANGPIWPMPTFTTTSSQMPRWSMTGIATSSYFESRDTGQLAIGVGAPSKADSYHRRNCCGDPPTTSRHGLVLDVEKSFCLRSIDMSDRRVARGCRSPELQEGTLP